MSVTIPKVVKTQQVESVLLDKAKSLALVAFIANESSSLPFDVGTTNICTVSLTSLETRTIPTTSNESGELTLISVQAESKGKSFLLGINGALLVYLCQMAQEGMTEAEIGFTVGLSKKDVKIAQAFTIAGKKIPYISEEDQRQFFASL